jgi:Abortive infection C-terminus
MLNDDLPDTPYERALMLENMLVAKAAGDHGTRDPIYTQLRQEFMNDPELKTLLPQFVRTCRDLSHFWSYAKKISPQWEPRRQHVREQFIPLLEYFDGQNRAPADAVVSDTLASFDADGVHAVWEKALARRRTDPEGAITIARTLLETVCKRVLDEAGPPGYPDDADLPKLYKTAAERLYIAPSQHTEDAFKRILGGCTSVVEGLGTLRNKIGDAHGKGGKPVRAAPRHAQLAVNLAGAMATFIVETWIAQKNKDSGAT